MVIAEAHRPPAAAKESLKPGEDFLSFIRSQDLHGTVQPLIPGADQLRVVHTAMGCFRRFLVRQNQPIGQISVFFIYHAGEVMVSQLRHIEWIEMLIFCHGHDRLSAGFF